MYLKYFSYISLDIRIINQIFKGKLYLLLLPITLKFQILFLKKIRPGEKNKFLSTL